RSIITKEWLREGQSHSTVSDLWRRNSGALNMQVFLTHWGQQTAWGVLCIRSHNVVRATTPVHWGASDASQGERSNRRANLNIAQGGFLNPWCQPVAVVYSVSARGEDVIGV